MTLPSLRSLRPLALGAALAAAGCSSSTDFSDSIIRQARQLWEENGPPSYTFHLIRLCECPGPSEAIRVEVRNGVVVSWHYVASGDPLESQFTSAYPEVIGLFDLIDDARRRNVFQMRTDFHRELGYPVLIEINYTPGRVDDDIRYAASDLTAVP